MKKLISYFLTLCVIVSCITIMPIQALALTASDVSVEAGFLKTIGVLTSIADETEGNREITRAEFAVTAAKTMGFKNTNDTGSYFTDIPSDHWSLSYVNRLIEIGILSQPADRLFRPNDKITVNEAVKMLVCMCGYGEYASLIGTYPQSYSEVASKLEFRVTGGSENLTVYKSYIMLYDALRSPTYVKTAAGAGFIEYNESEETMLSKYFDIYEADKLAREICYNKVKEV